MEAVRGKVGRPRGRTQDGEPWDRAEDLYVHGELVAAPNGPTTKYPSLREIARRCGLTPQGLHYRVRRFRWDERREQFRAAAGAKVDDVLAEVRAAGTKNVVEVLEAYLALFAEAVQQRKVRYDCVADFDRAVRLLAFVRGEAEQRKEMRHVLSLEELQRRHMDARRLAEHADPELAGVIGLPGDERVLVDERVEMAAACAE